MSGQPITEPMGALRALQECLGNVSADVKDALVELHALRTAQNKTDKCIAELQDVIGVTPSRARGMAGTHVEDVDGTEKTLIQSVAFIRSAVEMLLARDNLTGLSRPVSATSHAIPMPELNASSSHASPEKEYAHASIQSCSPSPSSTPGFIPVDWSIDASKSNVVVSLCSIRPTEHSGRDTHIPSATNTETDSQTPQHDNAYLASNTHLATHVISSHATCSDTLVVPLTTSATQCSSTHTLTSEPINFSHEVEPSGDLPMSPTAPLSSLTNIGDTPISASESISAAPGYPRQYTPVEANNEGLPSGLPTPPSEAFTDDREARVASRLTHEHGAPTDRRLVSCIHLRNLPIISTPPSLTPEPTVQGDRGIYRGIARQDSLGVVSGSLSPSTPPSLSPAVGSSHGVAHKVTEARTHSLDGTATVVLRGDATEEAVVDIEESTCRVPVITVTNEPPRSIAISDNDSSPAPQVAGDADLLATPRSSAKQPNNNELRECNPDSDGMRPRYSQMDGYDFQFSSPLRHPSPPASSTPSRYATPSEFSSSGPFQEEDEVWGALVRDGSGMSTPTLVYPSLPLMFSHEPSPAASLPPPSLEQLSTPSSESLAVDPSMLHDSLPLASRGAGLQRSPHGSLSSLTSLDDLEGESSKQPSVSTRAALEATVEHAGPQPVPVGGPGASLSDLALLARREPLKIRLRLPESMRKMKRKRDAGEEVAAEKEQDDAVFGNVSPCRRSGPRTPRPTVAQLAPESSPSSRPVVDTGGHPDSISCVSASRKKTKKLDGPTHTSIRQKHGSKRGSRGNPRFPMKYHVWNGQIVSVELDSEQEPKPMLEPLPQTLTTSPVSKPAVFHAEEPDKHAPSPARPRHRKGRGDEATKSPLSSPAGRRTSRIPRTVKPPKEAVWNTIYQDGEKWPELPKTFTHWDLQFIACDNCDKWYHYGCAGIGPGDPRLEPGTLFICTTCHTQTARRQTLRHQDDTCARPTCPEPQVTSDTETYYVEKLVGRKKMEGYIYMWLAKWEGYPMSQATWIPKENVIGDGTKLFNAFAVDAVEEGADLDQEVVLLREALEAGWTGDEVC